MDRNGYPCVYNGVLQMAQSKYIAIHQWTLIMDNGVSAGVERRHLTAGVCGGVCGPVPDV